MSALNCFSKFELKKGKRFIWPLSPETINEFCYWAITENKLKYSTVDAYVSSIAIVHRLRGYDDNACNNYICKLIIRGAENMTLYSPNKNRSRNIMSLPLLKILGNEIARSNWKVDSKQCIWAASLLAFFGTCRMGELLSSKETLYDPAATLLWGDLRYGKNSWLIHIKSPKSRQPGGEYIDIFQFANHNCCPVKALLAWQAISPHSKHADRPVFMMENGKLLTKGKFNETIRAILSTKLGKRATKITGHSFRAGIPSMLAKFPELASDSHIMGWGRWCSKAYLSYTRLKLDQKIKMFSKIVHVLSLSA